MTRPRIGVNTFVWHSPLGDEDMRALLPRIADWGFRAVELVLEQPGDWTPGLAADLCAEHDLVPVVSAVIPDGRNLVAAPRGEVEETQDYLRHCADVAQRIGAPVVGGPMYAAVGRTWRLGSDESHSDLLDELRENLAPVADHAAARGATLAVEPLNRYETSVLNTVDQAMELLDGLPPEGAGLLFDTYHANIEERDPAAALFAGAERLIAVQVCANDRGTPGSGHVQWDDYGRRLAEIGFDGNMSIESFTSENEVIATAACIWRPLADSQDALARDGLAFLSDLVDRHYA